MGDLKQRTKEFAIAIFNFVDELPSNPKGWTIAKQILRSGSSVGTNYREACRAKSDELVRVFVSSVKTVKKRLYAYS